MLEWLTGNARHIFTQPSSLPPPMTYPFWQEYESWGDGP